MSKRVGVQPANCSDSAGFYLGGRYFRIFFLDSLAKNLSTYQLRVVRMAVSPREERVKSAVVPFNLTLNGLLDERAEIYPFRNS